MKNLKLCADYFTAIALTMLCAASVHSASTVVMDFTRSNLGGGTATVPSKPSITCDTNLTWTCLFTATDTLSYRYVDNVALAHINADGSIYLQEMSSDATASTADYWSVTLPAWYVSNGLTSYSLVGTDCTFTIKPTITAGSVSDWTLSVRGKTTTVSTGPKGTTTTTNTCGGDVDQSGSGKAKPSKVKTGASGKGPGPK
ncbi:hypothetical protein [Limnohabitans sp. JirII-29]|uniref:hypothetical protein n=1 Tax=Limnohabitans sp. JirII-29 TaxID=1835756 RepID=UPI0011B297A0|nr:hypothetical protein [Limnohabitans sp. JirII-29]